MNNFDLVPQMSKLYDLRNSLKEGIVKFETEKKDYETILSALEDVENLPDGYVESLKQNLEVINLNLEKLPMRIKCLDELIAEHETGNVDVCTTVTLLFNAMAIYEENSEPAVIDCRESTEEEAGE